MTNAQIQLALMYEGGKTLENIYNSTGAYKQETLHAVALYRQAKRKKIIKTCDGCGFKCGNRPCVFPAGMCGLRRSYERKD